MTASPETLRQLTKPGICELLVRNTKCKVV